MQIWTNLKSGPNGAGLCEGDLLEIHTDELCTFIASEVMLEYRFIMHTFRGSPIDIAQEDSTQVDHIRVARYGFTLAGKKALLKAICWGVDNQQAEEDTEFYIYPKGTALTAIPPPSWVQQ